MTTYNNRQALQRQAADQARQSDVTNMVRDVHFAQPQLDAENDPLFLFANQVTENAADNAGVQGENRQICTTSLVEVSPPVIGEQQCHAYLESRSETCQKTLQVTVHKTYQPSCEHNEELLRAGQRGISVKGRDYSVVTSGVFCHSVSQQQARLELGMVVRNWQWSTNTFSPAHWNDWGGGDRNARWVTLIVDARTSFPTPELIYKRANKYPYYWAWLQGACHQDGTCRFVFSAKHHSNNDIHDLSGSGGAMAGGVELSFTLPKLVEHTRVEDSWQNDCIALQERSRSKYLRLCCGFCHFCHRSQL